MRKYKIWQVVGADTDEALFREFCFCSLGAVLRRHPECRFGELPQLPREAWECVYVYETEKEPSLDWLFALFNRFKEAEPEAPPTPEDFTGHSMSVSDIVETPDGRLWYCDSFGWEEVTWQSN